MFDKTLNTIMYLSKSNKYIIPLCLILFPSILNNSLISRSNYSLFSKDKQVFLCLFIILLKEMLYRKRYTLILKLNRASYEKTTKKKS